MIKVSIIIPVYNEQISLSKCLDRICNQSLQEIEIICINDGSNDNSLEILNMYASKDNRIKIINFDKNQGASIARNTGIDIAQGEYIGFVNSNDYVATDFFEKLYTKAIEINADAVKGELATFFNLDDPFSIMKNGINHLIKNNYHYFYKDFQTAIYKKQFLIKNNIKFATNLFFLDKFHFSFNACINYSKIEVIDDAIYYQNNTKSLPPKISISKLKPVKQEILKTIDLLNKNIKDENVYREIYSNISQILIDIYFNSNTKINIKDYLLEIFFELHLMKKISDCNSDVMNWLIKKAISENKFYEILNKQYKKLDYLNNNNKKPLLKILVSYIKPSYLFKSKILTPIHLGKAVETEISKDGIISEEDLNWLHKNCLFNDDFDGGISHINRRVGFLTGTYWAWKNYEKLGNPEYFGSFGYRRLLYTNNFENIQDYDLILPKKMSFSQNIKEQFISIHKEENFNKMINAMKNVYPNELENLNKYCNLNSGYFAEMYIMKKDLFFKFCEWIFPLLEFLLNDNIKPSYNYVYSNNTVNLDNRDIAFIIERLTGYYLYNLTLDEKIKYIENEVFEVIPTSVIIIDTTIQYNTNTDQARVTILPPSEDENTKK